MSSPHNRDKREPKEGNVTKVGNKYFEVDNYPHCKFNISSGVEENNSNYKCTVYIDLQTILDEEEAATIYRKLRKYFESYSTKLNLEQLRAIDNIIYPTI